MEKKLLEEIIEVLETIERNTNRSESNTSLVEMKLDELIDIGKKQNNLLKDLIHAVKNQ
jgi:predicted nucleic acid-binding protein